MPLEILFCYPKQCMYSESVTQCISVNWKEGRLGTSLLMLPSLPLPPPPFPLSFIFFLKNTQKHIYVCVYSSEDSLWKLALSFYCEYLTQVAGHIDKCLPISLHIFFWGEGGDSKITQALRETFWVFSCLFPSFIPFITLPPPSFFSQTEE